MQAQLAARLLRFLEVNLEQLLDLQVLKRVELNELIEAQTSAAFEELVVLENFVSYFAQVLNQLFVWTYIVFNLFPEFLLAQLQLPEYRGVQRLYPVQKH